MILTFSILNQQLIKSKTYPLTFEAALENWRKNKLLKKNLIESSKLMRIGSENSNSKPKDEKQIVSYESQNNVLKRLHEERLKRQQTTKIDQKKDEIYQNIYSKSLKSSTYSKQKKIPKNLFLNSLLSDERNIKDKPNSIALSSLFQEDPKTFNTGISKKIKGILMTSYGFVMEVLGPIAESGVPFVLVNDSPQNGEGKIQRNYSGYKNMSLVFPPRKNKGYGVFHTKLWLIKFQSFLRVVICTGNQHVQDWIVWLNAYWYQDFPLKGMKISDYDFESSDVQKQIFLKNSKKQTTTGPFSKNLQTNLNSKTGQTKKQTKLTHQQIISLLDDSDQIEQIDKKQGRKHEQQNQGDKKFNFEEDFKSTLITVLNNMFPKDFNLTKQTGIDIQKYDLADVKVILIPSIPGKHSQKDGSMNKFGMAKVKHIIKSIGPKIKKGSLSYNTSSLGNIDENFLRQLYFSFLPHAQSFSTSNYKIIYPSYKYITEATCGQASVLYLRKQNYYKSEIKKQVFYYYQPSRINNVKGAIPHLKTIVIENINPNSQEDKKQCIFFMGSHNMTKAAWGTYEKSDSQISFSNSELGVLFLNMNMEQLANFLPYQYPPKKYNDYDKPYLRE